MRTIEDLRKLAELNLCKNCFKKYTMLIEPNMRDWLFEPLSDWRITESKITQMVMKTKGVFKSGTVIISLGDDDKGSPNEVDAKVFREIKKWGFKKKIDYLHAKGILQRSSYRLLDKAREVRNNIHDDPIVTKLSEQDYALFSMAYAITSQIWIGVMSGYVEDTLTIFNSDAEKVAEKWLSKIDPSP